MHHPAAVGDVPLIQTEIERLEGDDVRPGAPVPDGGPESLTVRRLVRVVKQPVKWLDGE